MSDQISNMGNADANRIVISNDELFTDEVTNRVAQMHEAQKVALVRDVGAPTSTSTQATVKTVLFMLLAGLVGGVLAFGLLRLVFNGLNLFEDSVTMTNLAFSFILAFVIGLVVALSEPLFNQNWTKLGISAAIAVPVSAVSSLAIGALANVFYSSQVEDIYRRAYDMARDDAEFNDYVVSHLHIPRGIAWALVGCAVGITVGAASRSPKRLGLAIGGGVMGGFMGGFIFDFLPGEIVSQVVGISLLGLLIGGAVSLLEQTAKSKWIEIVSGGMSGKQFILYQQNLSIGSAPNADITLIKDSAIAPVAIRLYTRGPVTTIESVDPNCPVYLNGRLIVRETLTDSASIIIGNTQLRFREKSAQGAMPGSIVR